jgi:hypothetical protein
MQALMISAVALIEVTLEVRRPLRIQAPGQHEFQTMITRHRGDQGLRFPACDIVGRGAEILPSRWLDLRRLRCGALSLKDAFACCDWFHLHRVLILFVLGDGIGSGLHRFVRRIDPAQLLDARGDRADLHLVLHQSVEDYGVLAGTLAHVRRGRRHDEV